MTIRECVADTGRLRGPRGGPEEVFRGPRHPRLDQSLDACLDRGAAMLA